MRIAGESKPSIAGLRPAAPQLVDPAGSRAVRPAPQPQRGQRKGRTGVVVYVDTDTHFELKRMALEARCSLQELCTRGVMSLLRK